MSEKGLNSERGAHLLEIIVVIFLGVTSVLSAFTAWQSSMNGSAMSKCYNEGIATITNANEEYVSAGQDISNDMSLYMELVSLKYDWAYAEEGTVEEARASDVYDEFYNKFLSDNLRTAIEWAQEQEDTTGYYTSPFDYDAYYETIYADANATYQEGRDLLEQGHVYNTNGDKMGLIVIYYATVLFLLGICGTLKSNYLKLGLICFSGAVFAFATVQVFMVPFLLA